MIPSLFGFRFRQRLLPQLPALLLSLLLGALAVFLYRPEQLAGLQALRQELPDVFTFLGMEGSPHLAAHTGGLLYGFLMPLVVIFRAASSAHELVARPLADGRAAMYLASGHRRGAILLTLCLLVLLESLFLALASLLGQALSALVFFPGAGLAPLARQGLGFALVVLPFPALASLLAVRAASPRSAWRGSVLILSAFLLFSLFARLPGWTRALRFLTPLTLWKGALLSSGAGGFSDALWALPLTAVFLVLALLSFSRSEL